VQTDSDGDRHTRPESRLGGGLADRGLGGGHGPGGRCWSAAGASTAWWRTAAEQAGPEPERVHQRQPGEVAPGGLAGLGLGHGLLDRLGGVAQDVDQQEHQDAG
jgi:hypothetical protein